MPPRIRLAEAARVLQPLRQGSLDGLCGLYAVLNAIRLVLYPAQLPRRPLIELFEAGIAEIQRSRPDELNLSIGLDADEWWRVAEKVVDRAAELTGMRLQLKAISIRHDDQPLEVIGAIKAHARRGRPVLIGLDGSLDHWTVVARFTATRLILFDSWGHRWVAVGSVGLAGDETRHWITPGGLAELRPG